MFLVLHGLYGFMLPSVEDDIASPLQRSYQRDTLGCFKHLSREVLGRRWSFSLCGHIDLIFMKPG